MQKLFWWYGDNVLASLQLPDLSDSLHRKLEGVMIRYFAFPPILTPTLRTLRTSRTFWCWALECFKSQGARKRGSERGNNTSANRRQSLIAMKTNLSTAESFSITNPQRRIEIGHHSQISLLLQPLSVPKTCSFSPGFSPYLTQYLL